MIGGLELTDRQRDILFAIHEFGGENGGLTVQKLADTLKMPKRTLERELSYLEENGALKRKGKSEWEILV